MILLSEASSRLVRQPDPDSVASTIFGPWASCVQLDTDAVRSSAFSHAVPLIAASRVGGVKYQANAGSNPVASAYAKVYP